MTSPNVSGVLRANGVLSAAAQRTVRLHCEAGNAQAMIAAVSECMLSTAIALGKVPANAGIKTTALLQQTEEALAVLASDYHDRGGVLTAKGYTSIIGLVAEMAKLWLSTFSAPIPTVTIIPGTLSDPEIQDRLCVVALRLRRNLELASTAVDGKLQLDASKLDGICSAAAQAMFVALTEPNETNHKLIHGDA